MLNNHSAIAAFAAKPNSTDNWCPILPSLSIAGGVATISPTGTTRLYIPARATPTGTIWGVVTTSVAARTSKISSTDKNTNLPVPGIFSSLTWLM